MKKQVSFLLLVGALIPSCLRASYVCLEKNLNIHCMGSRIRSAKEIAPGSDYFLQIDSIQQPDKWYQLWSKWDNQLFPLRYNPDESCQASDPFIIIDESNQVHLVRWYKNYNAICQHVANGVRKLLAGLAAATLCGSYCFLNRQVIRHALTPPYLDNSQIMAGLGVTLATIATGMVFHDIFAYFKGREDRPEKWHLFKLIRTMARAINDFRRATWSNTNKFNSEFYLVNNTSSVLSCTVQAAQQAIESYMSMQLNDGDSKKSVYMQNLKRYNDLSQENNSTYSLIECPELNEKLTKYFQDSRLISTEPAAQVSSDSPHCSLCGQTHGNKKDPLLDNFSRASERCNILIIVKKDHSLVAAKPQQILMKNIRLI